MATMAASALGGWRHRTTFVLALSASAVGLGNLWRFSYLSGEHGGAPFVITYVMCMFLIAVPVMVAEVVLGKYSRAGPVVAFRHASDRSLRSRGWLWVGVLACLAGLLILSFYTVVAGWGLAYAGFMYQGVFASAPALEVGAHFAGFITEPWQQVYWQSLFLLVTACVVALGVRRGLGALVWLTVPVLLAMLVFLIKFAFDNGDMEAAQEFLFAVQPIDFSPTSALVALGHAFYTLGVGVGTGICYGAYAPERLPVGRSVIAVAVFDTMIALLAGLAIFPIVFANNMEPAAGPGLLFVSLPYAFGNIIQGELFGTVFFGLLVLAALGSAVAVMEPIVASIMQKTEVERITATVIAGITVWLLGIGVVASFSPEWKQGWFGNWNLFGFLDYTATAVLLPLVALLTAIFVGWRIRPEILRLQLNRESTAFFFLWRFLLRYIAPLAVALLIVAPYIEGRV